MNDDDKDSQWWCSEDLQLWHASLPDEQVMRTYSGLMPCSLLGGGRGHHQLHLLHGPRCGTTYTSLWQPQLEPPRYTLPNSSLDSCLAQTSNMVQASLAMLPLKNLHLRHNQMAAARSWVGLYHGSHARDAMLRGAGLSPTGPVSLLQLSLGVDLALDSDNTPGC